MVVARRNNFLIELCITFARFYFIFFEIVL